jgi:hypothetical protein
MHDPVEGKAGVSQLAEWGSVKYRAAIEAMISEAKLRDAVITLGMGFGLWDKKELRFESRTLTFTNSRFLDKRLHELAASGELQKRLLSAVEREIAKLLDEK